MDEEKNEIMDILIELYDDQTGVKHEYKQVSAEEVETA